jgi:hypothetical protein
MGLFKPAVPIAFCTLCVVGASGSWAQMGTSRKQSQSVWSEMNACRQQARKEFPDYTAEASAQRDRATERCLQSQNLPPVAPAANPPQNESSKSTNRE